MALNGLSKIAPIGHPLSQRNKANERAVGLGFGLGRERQGCTKSEKKGVGNVGIFYIVSGVGPVYHLLTLQALKRNFS